MLHSEMNVLEGESAHSATRGSEHLEGTLRIPENMASSLNVS